MDTAVSSSLRWGLVGGLAFLVLVQANYLLTGSAVSIWAVAAVTLLVSGVSAALTHVLRPVVVRRNERT